MPQTIGGRQCHVAELADFEVLQKNCQFAFGVLYDDASTETSLNLSDVNGYAYYNASNTNKGMRGCFVFNPAGSLNSAAPGPISSSRWACPDTAAGSIAPRRMESTAYCVTPPAAHSIPLPMYVIVRFSIPSTPISGDSTGATGSRTEPPRGTSMFRHTISTISGRMRF